MCVLVFQVFHGPTLKGLSLFLAHLWLVGTFLVFQLPAQGKSFNLESGYELFALRCPRRMTMKWMLVWSSLTSYRHTDVCRYLIAQEEVCSKPFNGVTLRAVWPLRERKHFSYANMPTLHVSHQPNLLMPPHKFHCCTAGNVQSHTCSWQRSSF